MEKFIYLALLGALLPDLLRIIKNKYEPELPSYLKSINFYLGLLFLLVVAVIAVYLSDVKTWKEALAIGFSAPEIVSRLVGSLSKRRENDEGVRGVGVNPTKVTKSTYDWWRS